MKKSLMLLIAIIATVLSANAQYNYGSSSYGSSSYSTSSYGVNTNSTYVKGYTKSNGTYVHGHYRSSQNSTIAPLMSFGVTLILLLLYIMQEV